jgi:hypothetical protein
LVSLGMMTIAYMACVKVNLEQPVNLFNRK